MSNEFVFQQVSACESPLLNIVFVHGLTGDASQTWTSAGNNEFWPSWLQDELEYLSVYTLGYPASLFEKWAKKEMDIFERANSVLEHFAANEIGNRPIAFITHSLGGILTKILIRKSIESEDEDYKKIANVTRLVIFLSTPHNGSSLANAIKVLPKSSKHIALLANETGFLDDLNQQYRSYANNRTDLTTKVYYETHATKNIAIVVTRDSADPGVAQCSPVAVDRDHINICKPSDKDDIVYLGIRRHISNLLDDVLSETPGSGVSSIGNDYANKSENDRRDLLEKLIDANREDEYGYANDAQNKFARSYAKTGLFTVARDEHETLLSEVEARFVTHVYHPLICKDAVDEEIRSALQTHVLDAIAAKRIGNTKFSTKAVLNALYFLTEQCHIRWDPAS